MQIREINVVDAIEEAGPLLREHWDEVARNKEVMVLKPNVPAYRALEEVGALIGLGAFTDDGRMVGYCVSIITHHLHYADLIYTSNDVIFIAATRRGSSAGIRLIDETERIAKERGSQLMLWHAKPGTALFEILQRMKRRNGKPRYAVQDVIYSRQL